MENANAFFFVHVSSEDSESVSGDCEVPPRAAEKYTPDFEALKMWWVLSEPVKMFLCSKLRFKTELPVHLPVLCSD